MRKYNSDVVVCKRIIKYHLSAICKPESFADIQYAKIGVEIIKVKYDQKTKLVTFIFKSSLAGRMALAREIRKIDRGWSTTGYWNRFFSKEDELNYASNW